MEKKPTSPLKKTVSLRDIRKTPLQTEKRDTVTEDGDRKEKTEDTAVIPSRKEKETESSSKIATSPVKKPRVRKYNNEDEEPLQVKNNGRDEERVTEKKDDISFCVSVSSFLSLSLCLCVFSLCLLFSTLSDPCLSSALPRLRSFSLPPRPRLL